MEISKTMFPDLARKHFTFLVSDYGFHEVHSEDGGIEWHSPTTQVQVIFNRSQTFVDIGPLTNPPGKRAWYGLSHICHLKEGHQVFSYHLDPDGWLRDPVGSTERDMARIAPFLRNYCDDLLRGDFSILPALDEWLLTDAWNE